MYQTVRNISSIKFSKKELNNLIVLARNGDEESLNKIIQSHSKMILKICQKFIQPSVSIEDLYQEGVIGIIDGIKSFDFSRGVKFTTFVTYHILNHVAEYCRRNINIVKIPVYLLSDSKKVKKFKASYWKEKRKLPDTKNICSSLKISPAKLRRIYDINSENISLDMCKDEDNNESTLLDKLKIDDKVNAFQNIFDNLTEQEYEMLELYSGIYNGGVKYSYKKLGEKYGLCFREMKKKIGQIKRKVKKELKKI